MPVDKKENTESYRSMQEGDYIWNMYKTLAKNRKIKAKIAS